MAAKSKAQSIIDENPVVVFSKSYCPYCKATKSLLNEKGAKYFLMELDQVGMLIFFFFFPHFVCTIRHLHTHLYIRIFFFFGLVN